MFFKGRCCDKNTTYLLSYCLGYRSVCWELSKSRLVESRDLIAVTPEELEKYAFPVSHQKIWKETGALHARNRKEQRVPLLLLFQS